MPPSRGQQGHLREDILKSRLLVPSSFLCRARSGPTWTALWTHMLPRSSGDIHPLHTCKKPTQSRSKSPDPDHCAYFSSDGLSFWFPYRTLVILICSVIFISFVFCPQLSSCSEYILRHFVLKKIIKMPAFRSILYSFITYKDMKL